MSLVRGAIHRRGVLDKFILWSRYISPDIISLSKDFFNGEKITVDAEVKVLYQEDEVMHMA